MANAGFEQIIKNYLDNRSKEDSLFAKAYAKAGKTIKECCNYIRSQAEKEMEDGCAFIENEVVFGWAVHYYDEDDIEVDNTASEKVEVRASESPAPVIRQQPVIKAVKKKRQEDNSLQLSLFGEL